MQRCGRIPWEGGQDAGVGRPSCHLAKSEILIEKPLAGEAEWFITHKRFCIKKIMFADFTTMW
jgi:hypothetical protein